MSNCLQGKSQMILRFLDRNENTKPTIALEYTYGRRTRGTVKDVAHIWELGGGISLINLMDIPLTSKNIEISSLIIVVDLTRPEEMWNTFYGLIDAARARVDNVLNELNDRDPNAYDRIIRNNKKRLGEHKDASLLKQFPIPLAVVGAKYDEFQNFESEMRKNICKALRFMAHSNFASLQMFSNKMENLVIRTRALISHLAFDTSASKTLSTDFNKPLSIPFGADSFEAIGAPTFGDSTLTKIRATNPRDIWRDAFKEIFPQMMFSNKMENLVIRTRALISHLAFDTSASKTLSTDFNKPLSIPFGADSFEAIGAPTFGDSTLTKIRATNPRDIWRDAFNEIFPQMVIVKALLLFFVALGQELKNELRDDPSNDPQYRESEIDKLLEQKLRDLELYIKQKKDRQALEEKAERQLQQQSSSFSKKNSLRLQYASAGNLNSLESPREQENP
uniref:Cytoplasmic dynein 2 light intermediate chain 1 n=1 Tax=Ascaris lumbricoides TaxID=6252 RepID=A0A0M3I491_ASCLU